MATKSKAKTKAPRQKKMPANLVEIYRRHAFRALYDAKHNAEVYERQAKSYEDTAKAYARDAERFKAEADKLEKESAAKEGEVVEKATNVFQLLQRHAGIATVSATKDGVLKLRTKLIFTDIRTADGSRTNERACIGAYEITIPPGGSSYIRVRNLTFPSQYDHWGIKHAQPCWGEWGSEINRLTKKMDHYGIVDMLFHFLRSQDDSGAFKRAHHWRDTRNLMDLTGVDPKIRRDDYVLVTADDADGKALKGYVGVVDWASEDAFSAEFKEDIKGHTGESQTKRPGFCWTMYRWRAIKISKEVYDGTAVKYRVLSTPDVEQRKALDAMPDGSTLAEATDLMRSMASLQPKLEVI